MSPAEPLPYEIRLGYLLSGLSGVLLTVGQAPWNLWLVSWVALVPLLVALKNKDLRQCFQLGYLCGLVHFLSTLYWIVHVVQHYGGLSLPFAVLVLLLLGGYLAFYPAAFAVIAWRFRDRSRLWLWLLPPAWVCLEWIRGQMVTGFPWADLGYSQTPLLFLIQTADLWGVYGVGWLVAWASVCIAGQIHRFPALPSLIVWSLCLVAAWGYGGKRLQDVTRLEEGKTGWPVAVVQGNIDQDEKWNPARQREILKRYRRLSLKAIAAKPSPGLVVWPETAMPFFYGYNEELTRRLNTMIHTLHRPVLFGAPALGVVNGRVRLFNKAFLVDAQGRLRAQYAKNHLVPFGEYVPWGRVLFFVHRLVQAAGDFAAGDSLRPLSLDGRKLGILICYEAIFPELARREVARGATLLVNITNDAWFGTSAAPYQHCEMARWRAIENRRPLVRCANTGISAIFDRAGRVLAKLPLGKEGFSVASPKPGGGATFYTRHGDLFVGFCFLVTIGGLLCYRPRLRKEPGTTKRKGSARGPDADGP